MTEFAPVPPAEGFGLERALRQSSELVAVAESMAFALADFEAIELPPSSPVDPAQLRAVASLYLASTLEAAGLIGAAEDLTRLARSGGLAGDLGDAVALIEQFWDDRNDRASPAERLALFGRLFGAPVGPADAASPLNAGFEELLLDLCDAIIKSTDRTGRGTGRVRTTGIRVAENLGSASNDLTLFLARDVLDALGRSIAILNHPAVKARLMARTLWECVAAVDRRFGRAARATLTHLRRGRAGMAVLAWLADAYPTLESTANPPVGEGSPAVDAAISWVDETLALADEQSPSFIPQPATSRASWASMG